LKRGEWRHWHLVAIKRVANQICDRVGVGKRRAILWVLKGARKRLDISMAEIRVPPSHRDTKS